MQIWTERKQKRIFQNRNRVDRAQNQPILYQTITGQIKSNTRVKITKKRIQTLFGGISVLVRVHWKSVSTNRFVKRIVGKSGRAHVVTTS